MQEIPSNVPNEYRPISAWGYVGYNLLFGLPLIGFIMLIVYALDSTNMNRRNYARSFFCTYLIVLAILLVCFIIFAAVGLFTFSSVSTY